jgi:peptidoglycan/LPS O-acetylase OafA/YrhL
MSDRAQTPWWRTPYGIVLCGFLAVAGFFLLTEHTAHVFGALPYLLLAACPLMHMFMHHGHGHQHGGDDGQDRDRQAPPPGAER